MQNWQNKIMLLQQSNEYLHKQELTLANNISNSTLAANDSNTNTRLHREIQLLDQKTTDYKLSIQKLSQYALMERFGSGPQYVAIQVAFVDPNSVGDSSNNSNSSSSSSKTNQQSSPNRNSGMDGHTIILELAAVNEMPHAVFWFLEQVTRGLYDGTSLYRSDAPHVIQGGPGEDTNLYRRFKQSGFDSVLIQAYHKIWTQHKAYTIGFSGHTGGPGFYINMRDNNNVNNNHHHDRPDGEQDEHDVPCCFGKIISGFDLVDYIHNFPVQPGPAHHALQKNVAMIVSMRLLKPNEPSFIANKTTEPS